MATMQQFNNISDLLRLSQGATKPILGTVKYSVAAFETGGLKQAPYWLRSKWPLRGGAQTGTLNPKPLGSAGSISYFLSNVVLLATTTKGAYCRTHSPNRGTDDRRAWFFLWCAMFWSQSLGPRDPMSDRCFKWKALQGSFVACSPTGFTIRWIQCVLNVLGMVWTCAKV